MRTRFVLFTILSLMVLPLGTMTGAVLEARGGGTHPQAASSAGSDMNVLDGSYFTINKGQVSSEVLFHTKDAYFTGSGAFFRILDKTKGNVVGLRFLGANSVVPEGQERTSFDSNFFIGNDPTGWATDVPNYKELVYENLYDDIDMVFRNVPEGMKYEFIVRPGGDPSDIMMEYEGAYIGNDGNTILISTPSGTIVDGGLFVYQDNGVRVPADVRLEGNIVSFSIPSYDPRETLIIDPLIFSTFFGGANSEVGHSMAVDSSGNVYVTGTTISSDFPATPGAYDTSYNASLDGFVLKLNSTGTGLLYATYFGGNSIDTLFSLVIDSSNNAYVTGETYSSDLPATAGAYMTAFGGNVDCFVFKLNATGDGLLYSTYIGGNSHDTAFDIAIDSSNNTYITGYAWAGNYPITGGAYCTTYAGMGDIFVTKMNPTGTGLVFSTWIGTATWDYGDAIAVGPSNEVYVLGRTNGTNFPITTGAYDSTYNGGQYDAVVLKLNSAGSALNYSTYLGGSNWEMLGDIGDLAVDASGNAYVTGSTYSSNYPTTAGAYSTTYGTGGDIFVTKVNDTGKGLVYSTFIGGSGEEIGYGITLDAMGNAYLTGSASATGFPTTLGAYCATYNGGATDAIVLILNSTGAGLIYSTYLGGNAVDIGHGIGLDGANNIYVAGQTTSGNFPVTGGAYCATAGSCDGFGSKLSIPFPPTMPRNPAAVAGDQYVQLDWTVPVSDGGLAITNYKIYRGPNAGSLTFFKTLGNVLSYNDTGLTNGVTYHYALVAVNGVGEGAWSAIVNGTPSTIPGVPQSMTAVIGDGYVNLTWQSPSNDGGRNVTGYRVLRGTGPTVLTPLILLGNMTCHNDTSVQNGVTYYYAVSALNMNGEGSNNTPISAIPGRSPSVPANLTAKVGDGYVHLSWDAPADTGGYALTGYKVYKGTGTGAMAHLSDLVAMELNDTTVENGQTYNYSVSAINSRGEGQRCPSVPAKPGKVPDAPTITATVGDGSIEISWTPGADGGYPIATFTIYRGTDVADLLGVGNASGTSYNDTTIEKGVTYFYAVSATNAMGEGPKSTAVEAMTADIPGAPENLTATGGFLGGLSSIGLTWALPKDNGGLSITGYVIYRATDGGLSQLSEVKTTVYNDIEVVRGTKYRYAVSAKNDIGVGPKTGEVEAIPFGLPGKVLDLKAVAGDGFVSLSWKAPDDDGGSPIQTYYILQNETFIDAVNSTTYNDTNAENGGQYKYQVAAKNLAGAGEASEVSAAPGGRPHAPENFTVEAKGTTVVLKWMAPQDTGGFDITEYTVYRGETAQSLAVYDIGGRATDFSYTDKDVIPGKTYYYAITARTTLGEGPKSTVAWAQVPNDGSGGGDGTEGGGQSQGLLMPLLLVAIIAVVLVVAILAWKKKAKGTGQGAVLQTQPPTPVSAPAQQQYEQPQPPPPQPEPQPVQQQQEMAYQPQYQEMPAQQYEQPPVQ